jgi:broad specificity polyphosphatase/5'/3'-nucleotidase SurE
MYFAHFFAARTLGKPFPADVDVLKIEIPKIATPDSPWVVTRLDRVSYYTPRITRSLDNQKLSGVFETTVAKGRFTRTGTDAHAMARGFVSITPLSLDCSSRTDLLELQKLVDPGYKQETHQELLG